MIDGWPLFYKDLLHISNLESNVGVCTLWTERRRVVDILEPQSFCVAGNLYRTAGISAIIRNIFANPRLRYICVWGNDLSESGDALAAFWKNGVDEAHHVVGAEGKLEREIPDDALGLVRQAVELIDLRHKPASELISVVNTLPSLPPFSEPRQFPVAEPEVPVSWPSESIGFRVEGSTVAQTWLMVLRTVLRYGLPKRTRYGNTRALKEALNVVAVVQSENPDDVFFPEYLPMSQRDLEDYYPQMLSATALDGTSYTYGSRLRDYDGVDQIAAMIDLIKRRPDSKKMYATTWKVKIDSMAMLEGDSPCLTQINGSVRDGLFYLTAHFRSQDVFGAWPLNMFAVRKLQKAISDEVGLGLGATIMITHSAHIYAWDWDRADEVLKKYYRTAMPRPWGLDPRGYAIISVEDGIIKLTAFSHEHEELVTLRGTTASKLCQTVAQEGIFSLPSHLLYIGRELQKAETALKLGIDYVQDRPLAIRTGKGSRS